MSLVDVRSDPISISNVILHLNSPENEAMLISGLVHSSKRLSPATCIKEYIGMLASADNPTPEGKASAFLTFTSGGAAAAASEVTPAQVAPATTTKSK
ncbi:hypothetical protein E1B28_002644 [Marasmius oreades]|uniref:Uncharacterized protein n=1 Tax=Marasmius oreades TaxID=181124 RepID=A0A9P7RP11_9AGAR|nr:uncharacterized protein E1B28_002644 [Marasmius oreades]KAG7086708.1 hypothetical protein E1B28_002644 [Marasmius oreades]